MSRFPCLRQDEDEPILVMGDEEYDEPDQLLAGLPERVLLSDFVESQEPETNAVAKVSTTRTTSSSHEHLISAVFVSQVVATVLRSFIGSFSHSVAAAVAAQSVR